ncbi:maleylpyruvate isomerase family mycothiol-dependent enzyme [Pseudoclavibacter sp. AY1F1]|uniref:maleylpyruvate isomerase family mycothiol-dependent enzyme n=1 Tax=Pseudoclavibacter sp. AY1F1 TaxID=2080583 RepID=UPI0021581B55|nr:maleylpyruvate isomerase family mycothiol-dependent enzyme [Pseudoclavibacter sp. AY1F1]
MSRQKTHWEIVHAERRALADDLTPLSDKEWATPSLCTGWTVHDVLAHLVNDATTTRLSFVAQLAAARFDFDALNQRGVESERRARPLDTLARFREVADRTSSAPTPAATRYVEAIVHGEDIRRPLGIAHTYPVDAVLEAIVHQRKTPVAMGGGRELAAGRRLVVTDAGTTAANPLSLGQGPAVRGTAIDLLLWLSGRDIAPEAIS